MIDEAELGVQIVETNVGISTVADDILGMTNKQSLTLLHFMVICMYHVR